MESIYNIVQLAYEHPFLTFFFLLAVFGRGRFSLFSLSRKED